MQIIPNYNKMTFNLPLVPCPVLRSIFAHNQQNLRFCLQFYQLVDPQIPTLVYVVKGGVAKWLATVMIDSVTAKKNKNENYSVQDSRVKQSMKSEIRQHFFGRRRNL